jgi:acyl-CoA hydrolase
VLVRLEESHHPGRLGASGPFVAVNTALQIDRTGQVNVEAVGGEPVGGVGGHPDFALAATRSLGGLSVVALPTRHAGRPTLVDRLDAPASTPRCDVDVVVTEHGAADLRGLCDAERAEALQALWPERQAVAVREAACSI